MKNVDKNPLVKIVPAVLAAACIACTFLWRHSGKRIFLALAITAGTTLYHFAIRFAAPVILWAIFRGTYNAGGWWFRQKRGETKLYSFLRVRKWKKKLPAWNAMQFSVAINPAGEIIQTMCHAEAVHELICGLSLASLLFAVPFGHFVVFCVTGVLAAAFDFSFVCIQRYNRPRVMNILRAKKGGNE